MANGFYREATRWKHMATFDLSGPGPTFSADRASAPASQQAGAGFYSVLYERPESSAQQEPDFFGDLNRLDAVRVRLRQRSYHHRIHHCPSRPRRVRLSLTSASYHARFLSTSSNHQDRFSYYASGMKTYGQRCPLARGLDIVGERWTLLVVRELMLGPRRYTDLADGLPGVGTNILAARLADLQSAGLVTKRELPPPTAVSVYELTEAGRALAPSLTALSEWGERHGTPTADSQAVRPQWILTSMARRNTHLLANRACELRIGRDVFELTGDGSNLAVTNGTARFPDATITLEPNVFYALATKRITPRKARERAIQDGDQAVAAQVLDAISGAAAG